MSEFLTDLCYRQVGKRTFIVTRPLEYQCDLTGSVIIVPAGFPSDGESSPVYLPIINSLFGGVAEQPAFVHDWLYHTAIYPRKTADDVLLEAMGAIFDLEEWRKKGIYYGLRLGGWWAWNEHRDRGHSLEQFTREHP